MMLDIDNRHHAGFALIPFVEALRSRGVLESISVRERADVAALANRLTTNAGLVVLVAEALDAFQWTSLQGSGARTWIDLIALYKCPPELLFTDKEAASKLASAIDLAFFECVSSCDADMAQGAITVLLAAALRNREVESFARSLRQDSRELAPKVLALFEREQLYDPQSDALTHAGRKWLDEAQHVTAVVACGPLLARAEALLFGDSARVMREQHLRLRENGITITAFSGWPSEILAVLAAGVGLFMEHSAQGCGAVLRDYVVRHAQEADVPSLRDLERSCWKHSRSSRSRLQMRVSTYPHGQFVLERGGRVLAVVYSQRIRSEDGLIGLTSREVHHLHDPSGPVIQLLALNVEPTEQNRGFGDELLEFMLQRCALVDGVARVVGVTLCKAYSRDLGIPFDRYIHQEGTSRDPVLAFHWLHGAEIIRPVPGYRPDDVANEGNGVLVAYDIGQRKPRRSSGLHLRGPLALTAAEIDSCVTGGIATLLGLSASKLDRARPLMEMGLDSAHLLLLQERFEQAFGIDLETGFFFDYGTPARVIAEIQARLGANTESTVAHAKDGVALAGSESLAFAGRSSSSDGAVAIVGMACKLPGGIESPEQLWSSLAAGDSAIGDFPASRGPWHAGISKGGFVTDLEAFDASLFRMSPAEAQITDPQQRLLLQATWACREDAGISLDELKGTRTGVFIGASNCDYSRLLQDMGAEIQAHQGVGSSLAILANRISYFFDLSGPSLLIDTACSSSLVALHTAIRSLRSGECDSAFVGGVNVICHPDLSIAYEKAGMLSPEGLCKPFDARADGYVRSEGAVMLLIKPLYAAIADGNLIHAVIRGSAINHGGLASGITVPNPRKQSELLVAAWQDAEVASHQLTYLEAHGTGTALGDPIEVQGMQMAFAALGDAQASETCAIGSVKSNLGHLESAAGLAGVLKVVLSMQRRELPSTLHFTQLNPKIRLKGTPFRIQSSHGAWAAPGPRCAGVSSFGSGGTNAHVVLEEFQPVRTIAPTHGVERALLFVLSAATEDRLRVHVEQCADWLSRHGANIRFVDAIHSWQIRDSRMQHRLAIKASDAGELQAKLREWLAGGGDLATRGIWSGQGEGQQEQIPQATAEAQRIEAALREGDIDLLGVSWSSGATVDWRRLHAGDAPWRISLPTYPFARERHWVEDLELSEARGCARGSGRATPHPLVHANTSGAAQQSFASTFSAGEFFLRDHRVEKAGDVRCILPAAAYLEMAREALRQVLPENARLAQWELRDVAWPQPAYALVDMPLKVSMSMSLREGGPTEFTISTVDGLHCRGYAVPSAGVAHADLNVEQALAGREWTEFDPVRLYTAFEGIGIHYGPTFQPVRWLGLGHGEAVARLRLPAPLNASLGRYELHPSLLDGALQTALALISLQEGVLHLPFALERLHAVRPCTEEMWVWVRLAADGTSDNATAKLDVDLRDDRGRMCAALRGLSMRAAGERARGALLALPVWEMAEGAGARAEEGMRRLVFACALPSAEGDALAAALPAAECLVLAPGDGSLQEGYGACTRACFERLQGLLKSRPDKRVLIQLAVPDDEESAVWGGLFGLVRTVGLENPRVQGQLIRVPRSIGAEALAGVLDEESTSPETVVRRGSGGRSVLRWREAAAVSEAVPCYRDDGVYLITGGLGGLGLLFAGEILSRTEHAKVVLCGRSRPVGELGLDASRVEYRVADVGERDQVEALLREVRASHGRLDGIVHGAGVLADSFVVKKDLEEIGRVLRAKVAGTCHLDEASAEDELDFFVLLASVAGVLGNVGQGDYAAANGFLDGFAACRHARVARGERHGRTVSIDWPLWAEGGMRIDEASRAWLAQSFGLGVLDTPSGMEAFRRCLASGTTQALVLCGEASKLRRTLREVSVRTVEAVREPGMDTAPSAQAAVEKYLCGALAEVLKLPASKLDPRARLEVYGIDSILAMKLTQRLEQAFGPLPKTLFFEYQTIRELGQYFVEQHGQKLRGLLASGSTVPAPPAPVAGPSALVRRRTRRKTATKSVASAEPIAIVGLSGRYPEAEDLAAYWRNLREGRDCIVEVPKDRWDWQAYFSADRSERGRHYSKWGGFIGGVDEFDPLFFNISPRDATYIDPQERLFLQHAWMALEDAGHTRAGLQQPDDEGLPGQVGVYVGVMYSEYQLFGAEATARGTPMGIAVSPASIANRVSYVLDLHGPSLTVDTMCSSSLTAIHLACQDLRAGRTHTALAGGVNVSVHPNKYLVLSAGQFISSEGHCQSFGEGGDGYIPGEGVGVVVLKRLSDAERDGDQIYGVIRGSALNHGGRTNGYTVPNPKAQASVIARAMREAGIDARRVGYVEAHGTGTKLGDPIEIAALTKAFEGWTREKGYCLLGSAKSNIGHCESAAGIAGLTKVLLQLKHRQIVPSLHSSRLNPHIDFAATPFVVNQALRAWDAPVVEGRTYPRVAGISSFGAGGSNAHVLVEEYRSADESRVRHGQVVVPLSARTAEQLERKASDLLAYLREQGAGVDLTALAYTLQVGREAMDERLALVVGSVGQLEAALQLPLAEGYRGRARRDQAGLAALGAEPAEMEAWLREGQLAKLAEAWAKGGEVAWEGLYQAGRPRRVSLPTYPFARERYWVELPPARPATAVLHPLLHSNTSDLGEQRYSTRFSGEEFFLADHRVRLGGGLRKVLPGVAYLEMAIAAATRALPVGTAQTVVELADTVFAQPLFVGPGHADLNIALMPAQAGRIDYMIYSGGEEAVHCRGCALTGDRGVQPTLSLAALRGQMTRESWDADRLYARCTALGLEYGKSFRTVVSLACGEDQLLAELRLPATIRSGAEDYGLHPSVLDGALQAAVSLMDAESKTLHLPVAVERVRIHASCRETAWAWVRPSPNGGSTLSFDVDLCDAQGNVCVQLRGLSTRAVESTAAGAHAAVTDTLLAVPYWERVPIADHARADYARRHVLICGLTEADAQSMASLLPNTTCTALPWSGDTLASKYEQSVLSCFAWVRALLEERPNGPLLVQLAIPDGGDASVSAGLAGLLKTASLENPQIRVQMVRLPTSTSTDALARLLDEESGQAETALWRTADTRYVLRWREPAWPTITNAFRDDGVYLVTGGLGGLGLLFARVILTRTKAGKVVLCGRSAPNEAALARLGDPGRVEYRVADISERTQVDALLDAIRSSHGRIDGILHSAGVVADGFLLKKDAENFRKVLQPKVAGTCHLDAASANDALDFFALFASVAGVFGNLGQGDYAAANGFLDSFATHRNAQVATGERQGLTLSIDWPLWADGGMKVDASTLEWLNAQGIQPLGTAGGLAAFDACLALGSHQALVLAGDHARIRALLSPGRDVPKKQGEKRRAAADAGSLDLQERARDYLRRAFSEVLKLAPSKIEARESFETYGVDSVLAMRLTQALERHFGELSRTLLFEYRNIADLAEYLIDAHHETLHSMFGTDAALPDTMVAVPSAPRPRPGNRFVAAATPEVADIAIVGVSGRYPEAEDLVAFWKNLREGRDCISEVPIERWDLRDYYDPDPSKPGKTYSKWGGFLSDIDKFDPLFFNISPREASLIDPQERLFMQTVWEAIEDAGYSKERIASRAIGVYVGVMWGQYELYGAEAMARGDAAVPLSSHASIANRISYFYDFRGPSLAVDTMCSSSLTALHLACEALRKGEVEAAVAGGVNLTVHPYKYLNLSQGKFVSTDGRCRSFGQGGDGYVPGEGVGAVILKPLQAALNDGDRVYAVIRSTAINHGGKTNGYSVPNPQAQAQVIADACRKAGIVPASLGYIEAHGTGTALGDPIEITGLCRAFADAAGARQACPVGSVKSAIGHLEAAAGMAAITKVLLQMKHAELAPSLHATPASEHIDFSQTPFYVQTELSAWKRPEGHPRRAGVSSFGAGGANAHVILEEYPQAPKRMPPPEGVPEACLLSARDAGALRRYVQRWVAYLETADASLPDMAYTSQTGRAQMGVRLAVVATDKVELREKLVRWLATQDGGALPDHDTESLEDVYDGSANSHAHRVDRLVEGRAGQAFLADLLASRDLPKLLGLWTIGVSVDWTQLRRDGEHRCVSIPTYPFARERYWVADKTDRRVAETAPSPRPVTVVQDSQRLYFRPSWRPEPLPAADEAAETRGVVLVLGDTGDLFPAFKAMLRGEDTPVVRLQWNTGGPLEWTAQDTCGLDPLDECQWRDLLQSLKESGRMPEAIVHCTYQQCNVLDEGQLSRRLDQGVYALFHLCRELLGHRHEAVRILSTYPTVVATAVDRAVGGFLRSIQAEQPRYLTKVVETCGGPDEASEQAGWLLDELRSSSWSAQKVLYRRSAEGVERLVGHWKSEPVAAPASLPLTTHGVYLISGGLGGLGLIFAEYLARRHRARLVLAGRSPLGSQQRAVRERLEAHGAEVLCMQADVSRREDVIRLVEAARQRFGKIDGVIHAAGVNRDGFVIRKTREDMAAVLAAKVAGATHLDAATREDDLRFFVLFGSVSGVFGNAGQSDYAYANDFLGAFAEDREQLRKIGLRAGRALAIDWPYWSEGGMQLSREDASLRERQSGLRPLPTVEGLLCWEDCLRSDAARVMVLYGNGELIAKAVSPAAASRPSAVPTRPVDSATLYEKTLTYLIGRIGAEIELAPERIGSADRFDALGIDSVMINRLNAALESDLGALPKTLFYEYETPEALTRHLLKCVHEPLQELLGNGSSGKPATLEHPDAKAAEPSCGRTLSAVDEPIAIIGVHGRYPHADELDSLWDLLRQGGDLVEEVPSDRWHAGSLYDPDPEAAARGKIYCKWGGFVRDHDKFDASFFNISPEEARIIDPQERLMLESVWAAIEDAGYTRESLKRSFPKGRSADVGVFVGVTTQSYPLLALEQETLGGAHMPANAMSWSIANRISYFFDFNGPSMPVDTACSSTLVALHMACESLRRSDCQLALVGGVNLYLHPAKYKSLCDRQMLSLDGKCHSYGEGGDGFVPGEAVGTLVLKPLRRAIEDRDHIYAVVAGSAQNHSGRANGYSAPNPNAQADLVATALQRADVHPESISYVEGHGTGTQLGDSLEIAALTQAFQRDTARQQFCRIGCVKANLGHAESAAGIASLTKVLLQIRHRQLLPSIHAERPNPHIDFTQTPFVLQQSLSDWPSPHEPRRALVTGFGAGGVNACAVIEEFVAQYPAEAVRSDHHLFVLSARTEERLLAYAERILAWLRANVGMGAAAVCYTLQVGREAMQERMALVVRDTPDLMAQLERWCQHAASAGLGEAGIESERPSKDAIDPAPSLHGELLQRWTAGQSVDWETLYDGVKPARISLPTYPFARERHWITDDLPLAHEGRRQAEDLHPLVSCNTSTLRESSFESVLRSDAFYATDHCVANEPIFPGAGFLEIACVVGSIAAERRVTRIGDIVWTSPLTFRTGTQSVRTHLRHAGDFAEFAIASSTDEPVVYCEGRIPLGPFEPGADLSPTSGILRDSMRRGAHRTGKAFYEQLRHRGFDYGRAFRTVEDIWLAEDFALSKLTLPGCLQENFAQFVLHPSLIDGAIQTISGLVAEAADAKHASVHYVPFALDDFEIRRALPQVCYAHARYADSNAVGSHGVGKFVVTLLNENEEVIVVLRNLYVSALLQNDPEQRQLAASL